MAASPALPGFGNSGKSFLIDNLLQPRTPSAPPAGGNLRLEACERLRTTWRSEQGTFPSQALSPTQVKGLGGHLLPHSGGKYTSLKIYVSLH